jgi:NADH-quinone oxidoreductase subunit F
MSHLTERIDQNHAASEDVELLNEVASQIKGKCLCALGEFSIEAVMTAIDRFPQDFQIQVLS